jgi:hypothetical protein
MVAEQQISLWFAAASYGLLDGMTDGGLGSVLNGSRLGVMEPNRRGRRLAQKPFSCL